MGKDRLSSIALECPVSRCGYQLKEVPIFIDGKTEVGRQHRALVITDYLPVDLRKLDEVTRDPLRGNDSLFMEFADLSQEPNDILEFANRYGLLGGPCRQRINIAGGSDKGQIVEGVGEPVESWRGEIVALRQAIDLWKMVSPIRQDAGRALKRETSDNSPSTKAIVELQAAIRKRTSGYIFVEVAEDAEKPCRLELRPRSLLAGLWMQLAVAVDDNLEFKRCIECGKSYNATPGAARKTKSYCSDACRAHAYRRRKAALQLETDEEKE